MDAKNVDTEISKGWNFTDTEQTVISMQLVMLIPDDKHVTILECMYLFLIALYLNKGFENHHLFTYFPP